MNSIKNTVMAGMLAISVVGGLPALADHDNRHNNNNNHDNDWNRRNINVRVNDNRFDDHHYNYNKHNRHNNVVVNDDRDWNGQRTLYRNNWNRMSHQRQQELDAQMRAQWLAYHHNNYEGDYTWNNYNDPRFLDYLHTSNPSLLTTLRNYIGF